MAYTKKEDKARYSKKYRNTEKGKNTIKKNIKQWRENNPEKVIKYRRISSFRKKYNLSYEDFLKMWEDQNGRCAICGIFFDELSDACVDHNHKTGKVRGLLCQNCNSALGFLKDDPELMLKAAVYLRFIEEIA